MDGIASSSPSASPDPDSTARRSRSGRVVKAPTKFAPDATAPSASKRKRDDLDQDGDEVDDADLTSDDDVSDEPDAVSDDDHPAPRSRKSSQGARPKKPTSRKPSSKKPRTNGTQPVASGHVARIPSRPKKTVRIDAGERGTGLFGRCTRRPRVRWIRADPLAADIFGSGDTPEAVSQQWLERYRQDDAAAMGDLVNCILQCAGCDLQVTTDDIRDPENIPNRLVDLQNVYQEVRAAPSIIDCFVPFFVGAPLTPSSKTLQNTL